MEMNDIPEWLRIAREIQALSQIGLTYTKDEYDVHRYNHLLELASEIVANHTDLERESVLKNFSAQSGYATPKIDVRGAIIRDGRILLVQESQDGKWAMPGGWADVGELPSAMVEREVWEESGFKAKAEKVVAVYDCNRIAPLELYHAYKIVFLCTIISGEPRPSSETLAVDFFDPNRLPALSSVRTNERIVHEVFAHVENPSRVAAFD
jgi:ADP-ribose pyrophosphatase YjhB (NUDIX family)